MAGGRIPCQHTVFHFIFDQAWSDMSLATVVDARCLSSKKERETSHRLSTQPGDVVTQGLISSQPKADVEPFSRFIPPVVLEVAMEGPPERHPLLVHDPLDGQIWWWRELGS